MNWTVLHAAALHMNVIEFVLNETNFGSALSARSANKINHKNSDGLTALYYAALKGDLDMFKFLYSKGADANVVTNVSLFFFMNFIRNLKIIIDRYFLCPAGANYFFRGITQYFMLQQYGDI